MRRAGGTRRRGGELGGKSQSRREREGETDEGGEQRARGRTREKEKVEGDGGWRKRNREKSSLDVSERRHVGPVPAQVDPVRGRALPGPTESVVPLCQERASELVQSTRHGSGLVGRRGDEATQAYGLGGGARRNSHAFECRLHRAGRGALPPCAVPAPGTTASSLCTG